MLHHESERTNPPVKYSREWKHVIGESRQWPRGAGAGTGSNARNCAFGLSQTLPLSHSTTRAVPIKYSAEYFEILPESQLNTHGSI